MAARFNEAMVARLIELVQSRHDDLNPPTRTAKANEKQKEAWKFVTDSMNREFPQEVPQGGLTIAQIQTKFKNLKQRAKDERQTEKKLIICGGKKFEMTEVSRNVSQLFADSPAFEGRYVFELMYRSQHAVLGTVPRGEAVKTPKFESSTSRVPFRSRAGTASTVTAADVLSITMADFQTFLANGLVAATMPLFFASQTYGKHLKVAKSKELFWVIVLTQHVAG
ncbi:hypothetical protein niasHT_036178 [Heterodera trifolii]|uniref:Myb/SANT-like DNA-binding domain-containing protein n=1 Tax=Heterodera trifolii TaxID=157864 RepID=A0ABD2IPC8_9BILA